MKRAYLVLVPIMVLGLAGCAKSRTMDIETAKRVLEDAGYTVTLNLEDVDAGTIPAKEVSVDDMETYSIQDMTFSLKDDGAGKNHYLLTSCVLYLDMSSKGYESFVSKGGFRTYEDVIKSKISTVISATTLDEIRDNEPKIRAEILKSFEDLFGSDFIYNIELSGSLYQ